MPSTNQKYGKATQDLIPEETTKELSKGKKIQVPKVVWCILYCTRAVNMTLLMASTITVEQWKVTEFSMYTVKQLLDYCVMHQNEKSDMICNIHSYALYLGSPKAKSHMARQFCPVWLPWDKHPIELNGPIHILASLLQFIAVSTAEAELGALFVNAREGKIIHLILMLMVHHHSTIPIHCDNCTSTGIANDTVKKQCSLSMEMRYFWITDQVAQKHFTVHWHLGQENLADYFTKFHLAAHHTQVRPYYLQMDHSPAYLPRATALSVMLGFVRTNAHG